MFLIDSHFMVDGGKFISGAMAALSVMVNLEVPHVNVLSKVRRNLQSTIKRHDSQTPDYATLFFVSKIKHFNWYIW